MVQLNRDENLCCISHHVRAVYSWLWSGWNCVPCFAPWKLVTLLVNCIWIHGTGPQSIAWAPGAISSNRNKIHEYWQRNQSEFAFALRSVSHFLVCTCRPHCLSIAESLCARPPRLLKGHKTLEHMRLPDGSPMNVPPAIGRTGHTEDFLQKWSPTKHAKLLLSCYWVDLIFIMENGTVKMRLGHMETIVKTQHFLQTHIEMVLLWGTAMPADIPVWHLTPILILVDLLLFLLRLFLYGTRNQNQPL